MSSSIIIEDGYVVGQAQAEQPQQKSWKAGCILMEIIKGVIPCAKKSCGLWSGRNWQIYVCQ